MSLLPCTTAAVGFSPDWEQARQAFAESVLILHERGFSSSSLNLAGVLELIPAF